jgi:hypothetical protein
VVCDWGGGCGLVVIEPNPPQCSAEAMDRPDWEKLALGGFSADRLVATRRLARHFGELGFERVGSLPYLLSSPKHCGIPVQELDIRGSVFIPGDVLDSLRTPG